MQDITTPPQPPRRPTPRRVTTFSLVTDRRNWPVWIVPVVCAIVFAGQQLGLVSSEIWAFSPDAMREGRWWTLLTAIFLHAQEPEVGYFHIASNMFAYIQMSPLVAARFGKGWRGVVPYHLFYLFCGVAGNVLFWFMHSGGHNSVVGASGAVYGVYAAMMRLDLFEERLKPMVSTATRDAIWFLVWSNLLVMVVFGGPMILLDILAGHGANLAVPIAWEAHLGGFIAGFFMIAVMKGDGWDRDWKAGLVIFRQSRDDTVF